MCISCLREQTRRVHVYAVPPPRGETFTDVTTLLKGGLTVGESSHATGREQESQRARERKSKRARGGEGGKEGGKEQWLDRVAFRLQDLPQLRLVSILFDADYVDLHLFLTRTAQPERESVRTRE